MKNVSKSLVRSVYKEEKIGTSGYPVGTLQGELQLFATTLRPQQEQASKNVNLRVYSEQFGAFTGLQARFPLSIAFDEFQ